MLVPPQAPKYHFQTAPAPSFPPLVDNVDEFPKHIVEAPVIAVAETEESLITVVLKAQAPGQLVPVAAK
jgi:hypothetical protein